MGPMRTGGRLQALAIGVAIVVAACGVTPTPSWTIGPTAPPAPSATVAPTPSTGSPVPSPAVAPSPSTAPAPSPTPATAIAGGWSFAGTQRCPAGSEFECVTLSVPRDHFAQGGPTWNIGFAIHRATGKRVGTYVVIVGGPGGSGIASADDYTSYYPASIPRHFDIVFLDQRGIGQSHPITCPNATVAFYDSDANPADPTQAQAAGDAARTYVSDCLAEAGADPADLPFYSTRQAVEDLEAVREYLGVDKLDLYGESYGTQFVQTYAAAYPDHIATLYLDGPVDLTLNGAEFYAEAARTFGDALDAILVRCASQAACRADFGGDPVAAYEELEGKLAAGITLDFPMGNGTTQPRTLTAADLENAVTGYLYGPTGRLLLQRALAAASRGDYVPLARIAYRSIEMDPDTQQAVPDPTYSDAMYYAVECQDYVYQDDKTTDEARLAGFLADARALGIADSRFGDVYYADMPCLYWPNRPAIDPRPAPIVDAPYPTIIMVATTDPITPVANAIRLANRLRDVHVIIQAGGPHVIFGWGRSCPDEVVAAYMVQGKPLASRVTVCNGSVADAYVALAPVTEAEFRNGVQFMSSTVDQVLNTDDYLYELDADPIRVGCDYGGVLVYTPDDTGTRLGLDACELTDGVPITGTGSINDDTGRVRLDVTIPDGSLHYRGDGYGSATITGTFRGRPVKG